MLPVRIPPCVSEYAPLHIAFCQVDIATNSAHCFLSGHTKRKKTCRKRLFRGTAEGQRGTHAIQQGFYYGILDKQAETISEKLKRGNLVFIEGTLPALRN